MATSYLGKLKNPRWQKKRLEIFERDGWSCQLCGDNKNTLTVHHDYYEAGKEPWEYPDDSLATLCVDCHEKITKKNKDIEFEKKTKKSLRLYKAYLEEKMIYCFPYNELSQKLDCITYLLEN